MAATRKRRAAVGGKPPRRDNEPKGKLRERGGYLRGQVKLHSRTEIKYRKERVQSRRHNKQRERTPKRWNTQLLARNTNLLTDAHKTDQLARSSKAP